MSEQPPIVLDTCVLLSAFAGRSGLSGAALDFALKRYRLVQSTETLQELADKIEIRPFTLEVSTAAERAAFIEDIARLSDVYERVRGIDACSDPKDNMFLGLALATGAPLIVSADKDLFGMGGFQGTRIITPKQFVPAERLAEARLSQGGGAGRIRPMAPHPWMQPLKIR